jgi:tetratricopeptide (TPR) repeat protein
VIIRSTALNLLTAYPGEESAWAIKLALMDDEALIRRTAVESIQISDQKEQIQLIAPLLYDPVKAVRIEVARQLAGESSKQLSSDQRKVFKTALKEFETSMEYSADFAFARHNLANLDMALNRQEEAVKSYLAAIKIDGFFYPAKVNLAMLYNQKGENDKAETLLREVISENPEMHEIAYSLGLLLTEMKKYDQAAIYLKMAAKGMPERDRVHYNLGLLLQYLQRDAEAEASLIKAWGLDADSMDYLYALADHYLKRGQLQKAQNIAEQMVAKHPTNRIGHNLLELIETLIERKQNEETF